MALTWINSESTYRAKGEYIFFRRMGTSESGLTDVYHVIEKGGQTTLGRIMWFARWRKYSFEPVTNYRTVYEWICLRDIAEFCEQVTQQHKMKSRE